MSSIAVEQIKERLNIVEVVSSYLKLEKSGVNFRAPCPFHHERTPSFFVSPSRQSYHCFGCNRGGDIFSFVQDIEGLDFVGALKVLAERAGVELTALPRGEAKSNERLLEVMAAATRFFQARLSGESAVRDYLTGRGLTGETMERFQLGWAPDEWRTLYDALTLKQYSTKELTEAGLLITNGNRSYDRFRGRIMFPLHDAAGRVVGFSGRVFAPPGVTVPETVGKYINTPETKLYSKSKILYGYYQAKTAIRRAAQAVIVEGQMDLLLAHQAGVEHTVAVSGTALTPHHLELLKRLAKHIVMAFDADSAGVSASRRAVSLALQARLEVKIAELPPGLDPADLILQDAAAWHRAIAEAKHAIDFYLAVAARTGLDRREFAHTVKRDIYPLLLELPERIDRAHFVHQVAGQLGLAEAVVEADLEDLRTERPRTTATPGEVTPSSGAVTPSRLHLIERQLMGLLWWLSKADTATTLDVQQSIALAFGDSWPERECTWQEQKSQLLFEAEAQYHQRTDLQLAGDWQELLHNWQHEQTRLALREATAELARAEASGDTRAIEAALARCQTLSRELTNFGMMQ